jgi:sugar lactone lactonase YvrE
MHQLQRALPLILLCGVANAQTIFTFAGLPYSHRAAIDGKPAVAAPLGSVYGLLFDKLTGRLLLHDERLVSRLEPDGTLLALVGMGRGNDGTVSDGTLASGLNIADLRGMAQDSTGALYLADAAAGRVYRVGLDGAVTNFVAEVPNGALMSPRGMGFDSKGNLDFAEAYCQCIRRVSPAGVISTVYTLPQQPGPFQYFEGLAIDSRDNLYATEYRGSSVLKLAADGTVTTLAGTGVPGFSGDGGPATAAQLNGPSGVTLDSAGNLYITDTLNHRVRRITPDGTISTFAGTGVAGFSGDGGAATAAQLSMPAQTVVDSAGSLYISDYNNRRVRVVSGAGTISTIAGNGAVDPPIVPETEVGDGGPALYARFDIAGSAAFSSTGDLYAADMLNHRIRKITPDGLITTFAGNGQGFAYSGDGGPAFNASIGAPITVVVDRTGTVYFDTGDSRVLKVTPDGIIHLVAGTGTGTGPIRSGGDGGPAVNATLNEPKGLAIDGQGNVYIGDTSNARLRKVDANGIITTVSGPGILGTDYWNAVAFDPQGSLYVAITHADPTNSYSVIDRVNSDGSLTRVAGNSQPCANLYQTGFVYDGSQATQMPLCTVVGLTFDARGVMYIPESFFGAVLRVAKDGTVTRIVGSSLNLQLGDGGPPLLASLQTSAGFSPGSIAFDAAGNMILPQAGANRLREVIGGPLMIRFSQDSVDFAPTTSQGTAPLTASQQVLTNVAEPLPFVVKVIGGAWLTVDRVTGQTGDKLGLAASSAGLSPGVYMASIQISIPGSTAAAASLPVTFTVR